MMHVRVPCEGDEGVDIEQRYDRSVLVEGSAHHLGRDRRSAGGHADDRQAIGGLDAGGGQPTARELGDERRSIAASSFAAATTSSSISSVVRTG
jgi:hypothetical protein